MKVKPVSLLGGLALAAASLAAVPAALPASASASASGAVSAAPVTARPWTNAGLSPEKRAALLVARMTLDEKIARCTARGTRCR